MKNDLILFSMEEGNFLIRLLLAHFASDFILQNKYLVDNKKWVSKQMLIHIAIVFITTLALSKSFVISLSIAMLHWIVDALKIQLLKKNRNWESRLFFIDQLIHLMSIITIWTIHFKISIKLYKAIELPFLNYKISLIILAYVFVIYPVGHIIKYLTSKISPTKPSNDIKENSNSSEILDGGKLIGQFERLIILTFVLLNQYEAIGFLITGKSIIRFAQKDENLRSEYVLVGTMMSYAIAIITGVIINNLLNL
jgi:hypothetical protein